mmetsp:Transcript_58570/g.126743  ORF Transcript_58570/g.126743 Transcript_58570/m.126743 type:complete len:533 (-) Transcript_58570:238-1836(-)
MLLPRLFLLHIIACSAVPPRLREEPVQELWPLPQHVTSGEHVVALQQSSFKFTLPEPSLAVLAEAVKRFDPLFFPHASEAALPGDLELLRGITITIEDGAAELSLGVDESYVLDVPEKGSVVLKAATVWGALHGLQTLSQLISFDFGTKVYVVRGAPWHIADSPRFPHRGILIDSGRHFEPLPALKRFIDTLPYAKFNVMHWHLTEDQSFPIESRPFPDLSMRGAWSSREIYTSEDVRSIVEYARLRGVRVIPEFDMPGHTSSWRNAKPEFFASACLDPVSRGALDPANPETFNFLEAVLRDWTDGVFSDEYIHLGSDEVPSGCWNNTKDLAWMKKMGLQTFNDVFNFFITTMVKVATKLGKQVIFWDEAFISATPPKEVIIQNWHEASLFKSIIEKGYRGIYSPAAAGWYLDFLDNSWQKMYNLDPMFDISPSLEAQVLGGEGCMWGETVDPSDLEFTVWPRAAAIAERLWSQASVNSTEEALPRLQAFRCQLLERGVSAGTVGSGGRQAPEGPGSCSQGPAKPIDEIIIL